MKPFVILGPVDRLDFAAPGHSLNGRVRVVAPIDPPQLTSNLGAGGLVHQAGDQHVPALDVGSPQFVARGLRRIERRDCHRLAASRNPIAMGKGATEEPVPSTPAWEESAASLQPPPRGPTGAAPATTTRCPDELAPLPPTSCATFWTSPTASPPKSPARAAPAGTTLALLPSAPIAYFRSPREVGI